MAPPSPQNPDQFEGHVKDLLEKNYGYDVIKPPKGTFGYDLEIIRDGKSIAVQVKKYKIPVNRGHVQKFMGFMGLHHAESQFSEGWLISSSGFSRAAIEHFNNEFRENPKASVVSLGTVYQQDIRWDYLHPQSSFHPHQDSSKEISLPISSDHHQGKTHRRYYFGIFTNKGGTGKTTVAAHLAGAFTLMGYDVILLDIDPQRNLKKLFQEDKDDLGAAASLYVQSLRPGQIGNVISVLDDQEWEKDKNNHDDIKIVICDCNPTFEQNPSDLVKQFDYCVVPTTLNPLGVSKNSDVIKRTFKKIRTKNSKAQMHVLINHYTEYKNKERRNNLLLDLLKKQISFDENDKSYLIDPHICAIHRSDSLYYWGMHIVEKKDPQLGFETHGGKCVPREDFLKLVEYFRKRFEEP